MFIYSMTAIVTIAFIVSFIHDRRKLSNAFLFLCMLGGLFLSSAQFAYERQMDDIHVLFMIVLYGMIPLGLFIFSVFMIINGFVTLKREGKRLANSLSILFGLGMIGYAAVFVWYFTYFFSIDDQYILLKNVIRYSFIMGTFLFIVLMFIFFAFLTYSVLYLTLPRKKDYDFIIIHGSGLLNGDQVPPLLASRIEKALEAYRVAEKPNVQLIASGGQGADERISEAQAIATYLKERGIREDVILLEDRSTTTYENLQYSHELALARHPEPKYLFVSNNYHIFRASLYAKRLGMNGEGVGSKTAGYYIPSAFLREYIAILNKIKLPLAVMTILFALFVYLM